MNRNNINDCQNIECYQDTCLGCKYDNEVRIDYTSLEVVQEIENNIPIFNCKGKRIG